MIVLDVPHVFRVSHGPRGLLNWFDQHQPGHGLPYATVQMWQQRNRIPVNYLAAVLYCVECEGHQCREFFTDNDEFVAPKAHHANVNNRASARR